MTLQQGLYVVPSSWQLSNFWFSEDDEKEDAAQNEQ